MDKKEFVYYFVYGSNLLQERFEYYVKGGRYPTTGRNHSGCSDRTLYFLGEPPIKYVAKNLSLFFANRSSSWEGQGVAFVEEKPGKEVLGRLYKVTKEQFDEIQTQECKKSTWYGRVIGSDYLGEYNGLEIQTITCDLGKNKENPPSDKYITVIKNGLAETGYDVKEIDSYLS